VQDLLDGLTNNPGGGGTPALPNVDLPPLPAGVDPQQALDYLLGP
jgi:hypothetical protein